MSSDITELLRRATAGEEGVFDQVVARVYGELEQFAERHMRRSFGRNLAGLTLEPRALVNETFLKLLRRPRDFANRRHFFAFANRVLLRVLVDYQRARSAEKRGGELLRVTLAEVPELEPAPADLSFVLEELERLDERKAEVVKLRIFWGLEMDEIATTLEISLRTVERDWRFCRSWLKSKLETE